MPDVELRTRAAILAAFNKRPRDRFVLTAEGWKFAERRGRMVLKPT